MEEVRAQEFLDLFLAGELEELELALDQYGALANLVAPEAWIPKDENRFELVTKRGRLLYRKEAISGDGGMDVRLTLESEVDDGQGKD